jgi:hypothetical protein
MAKKIVRIPQKNRGGSFGEQIPVGFGSLQGGGYAPYEPD